MIPEQPQNIVALEKANAIRFERARLKREFRAGHIPFVELLRSPCFAKASISELLQLQHRMGRVRMLKILSLVSGALGGHISESRRIEDLTERQVDALSQAVDQCMSRRKAA